MSLKKTIRLFSWFKHIKVEHIEVLLASIALLVAILLYKQTQEQVSVAQEANRITLEALKYSAVNDSISNLATQRSLAIADSSLAITRNQNNFFNGVYKNESRAFLIIENITVEKLAVNDYIDIYAEVVNVGSTIASNVFFGFDFFVDSVEYVENPNYTFYSPEPTNMPPQKKIKRKAIHSLLRPHVDWFMYGEESSFDREERYLFIIGYITYEDIFRGIHEIRFFGKWNRKTKNFDMNYLKEK